MSLTRAMAEERTFKGTDANIPGTTRLMRLFSEQLEALARLKGTASQEKAPSHRSTFSAVRAIVGSVQASKVDPGGGVGV
jgi:hypothetical protein